MNKYISVLLALLLVAGCKTTEQHYYHGNYNKAVYSYFKGDDISVEEQIQLLTQVIQNAGASNKPVAPGIHAHLGMLYFEVGNQDSGFTHLEHEKNLFPESSQYIDFLIKTAKGA